MDKSKKKLNIDHLIEWNKQGFLCQIEEKKEEYLNRYFLYKKQAAQPFFLSYNTAWDEALLSAQQKLCSLYDMNPHPERIAVNIDHGLLKFWEAGCTWIEQEGKAPVQALLHIRSSYFAQNFSFLRLIKPLKTVLAHELVHYCRSRITYSRYEECFAYLTEKEYSFSGLYSKWLGPLFASETQAVSCMALCMLPLLIQSGFFIFDRATPLLNLVSLLAWVPFLLYMAILCCKLALTWKLFYQCKKNLTSFLRYYEKEKNVLAVMIRLSDEEITQFAQDEQKAHAEIVQKITQANLELRWRLLKEAYFS